MAEGTHGLIVEGVVTAKVATGLGDQGSEDRGTGAHRPATSASPPSPSATHNLGDVLEARTQQEVNHGLEAHWTKHSPIWTRDELDAETDPKRWRRCLKQLDKAGRP